MHNPEIPPAGADVATFRSSRTAGIDPARWQRLQELFDGLLARAPEAREAWLAGLGDEETLKREALRLVEADAGEDRVAGFLHAGLRAYALPPGHRLGPYRLVEEIGNGGMGTVFLAERADGSFDQNVAIKLLRGFPTRDSTERMLRERQILADLHHPGIARLLDGGSTADGQPYLVMEHVDGVPLNEFCRRRDPPLAARLQLIGKICAAVQYAHQRLVIHRDLKPANVLVRADGEPILLDFGIAKLLDHSDAPAETTRLPWLSPAYASPEQRRGQRVDTSTDVYSLGVLLHEIVYGVAPAADGQLPLPDRSSRLRVRKDLARIIAQATHAEPERRYATAAALAEDLRNFLGDRPVLAARDRPLYRLVKFVRRNRLAVVATACAVVVGAGLTWRLAQERDRARQAESIAERRSAAAEDVVDYLVALFRSASPENSGNRSITPRDLVDRGREEIGARLNDAPEHQARLLATLGKLYTELGSTQPAIDTLGQAVDLARAHGTPRQRAAYLADQGFAMILAERTDLAQATLQEAIDTLGAAARDERKLAAEILSTLAIAQARNGDPATAEAHVRRALDYASDMTGRDRIAYARSLYALAEVKIRLNHLDDAEREAERSIALLQSLLPIDAPEVLNAQGILETVYEQQGRYADGERVLRRMLEARLRTLDPASLWVVTTRINLAQMVQLQGRIVEAIALMRETQELLRASGQRRSPSYSLVLNNLASALEQAGDFAGAQPMFREAFDLLKEQSEDPDSPSLAVYRLNLGFNLLKNGQMDAALPLIAAPVKGSDDSRDVNVARVNRLFRLAEWMRRSHRLDEALAHTEQLAAALSTLEPPTHPRFGYLARARGLILRDGGHLAEAETELRRAAEMLSEKIGRNANNTIETELDLAEVLLMRGKVDDARALHQRMAPLLAERFVPQSAVRTRHLAMARQLGEVAAR
ncbi:serine/threonine-protein kinase [Dokdonella sp.]|uniref:serine/threonine-protein kinase n=1 Tax=Dokdonella sp. TaxID=2291710 RepID=UPI001B1C9647|nr:serine/threonine-protein kinase [Dokdonella sp.]MBO9663977.1 tetratricopeptide repeat protein [Dokdonella sp.]